MASQSESARDFLPAQSGLAALARAARSCRGCPLYANATQTVFGEGLARARQTLVDDLKRVRVVLDAGQPA